jgi:hypothetical protein
LSNIVLSLCAYTVPSWWFREMGSVIYGHIIAYTLSSTKLEIRAK